MRVVRTKAVVFTTVVVMGATIGLSGCGSSSGGTGATGGSGHSAGTPTLTIGISGASTTVAELVIAQEKGYFKKFGVNVDIKNNGSLSITQVAAGQIDLAQFGASGAFSAAKSGRQTSIIYGPLGNVAEGIQVPGDSALKPKKATGDTLLELAGKRVAVQGVGTSSYGNAQAINGYLQSKGKPKMTLVSYVSTDSITSALVSGQIDAAVGIPNGMVKNINKKKIKILVSQDDPTIIRITGGDFPGIGIFGLQNNLQQKKTAVTGFISAIRAAWAYIEKESVATISKELRKNSLFTSFPVDNLTQQLAYDKPFWNPDAGYISSETWDSTLKAFGTWGLGLDLKQPRYSYNKIVDMSYYKASQKP